MGQLNWGTPTRITSHRRRTPVRGVLTNAWFYAVILVMAAIVAAFIEIPLLFGG